MFQLKISAIAIAALMFLPACSTGYEQAATPAPAGGSPEVASPEPTPEVLLPDGIACFTKKYDKVRYATPEDAWAGKHDYCETNKFNRSYTPTKKEMRALRVADDGTSSRVLAILYDECAMVGQDYQEWPWNDGQISWWRGALALCPDHPDRKIIEESMKLQGTRFRSGTYIVGREIQPGTYASESLGGCYWERTDANGETIDNNFVVGEGTRVQVTISPGDYSFTSSDCDMWQLVQ